MSFLIKEITNIIEKNNSIIDEKYVGINYLEKIKYLIINSLKDSQDKSLVNKLASDLKEKNNQLIKFEYKNQSLDVSIKLYNDSLSKIRSCCNNDILSIVINGIKTISLFSKDNKKKNFSLLISSPGMT